MFGSMSRMALLKLNHEMVKQTGRPAAYYNPYPDKEKKKTFAQQANDNYKILEDVDPKYL